LGKIAAAEQITIEPDALESVGAAARGSFRDAISLLDQLSSATTGLITGAMVREILGLSDVQAITALNQALSTSDVRAALEQLQELSVAGAQPTQVATQLVEQWRAVLLAATGAKATTDPAVQKLAAAVTPYRTAEIIEELLEVTRSHWPGLALEATVAKLATSPSLVPVTPAAAAKPTIAKPDATGLKPGRTHQPLSKSEPEPIAVDTGANLEPALWPKVVVLIKQQNNSLGALLQMYPTEMDSAEIVIKPRFNFHRDLFLKPANVRVIEAAAAKVYRRPVKVTARTDNPESVKPSSKPNPSAELISSALEILGGEVVD
jgi:DNA polymerase III gamma/tau subunit